MVNLHLLVEWEVRGWYADIEWRTAQVMFACNEVYVFCSILKSQLLDAVLLFGNIGERIACPASSVSSVIDLAEPN